jgi:hypothetical protein
VESTLDLVHVANLSQVALAGRAVCRRVEAQGHQPAPGAPRRGRAAGAAAPLPRTAN